MSDEELEDEYNRQFRITSGSLKNDPDYVKCPRCWFYHRTKMNHDGLCDRCCGVLVILDHESAPAIRAAYKAQSDHFRSIQ